MLRCIVILTPLLSLLGVSVVLAADFTQFRGNGGQGHSEETGLPTEWTDSQNVAWKVPIEGLGWSSPAIQGDQIWLTTAVDLGDDAFSLRAICLDRASGKSRHDVELFQIKNHQPVHAKNSRASPTPLIEGDRVYVHFGTYGTACLSMAGEMLWKTQELEFRHQHGPAGSPVVYKDLLLFNCDGTDIQFMVALNKTTGEITWKTPRKHIAAARLRGEKNAPMGFSTPLLIEVDGRPQLISTGADHVAAYDPLTGEEIWWSEYDGYSLVPRPVFGHGLVYVCSGYGAPVIYAIRPDGAGEVTATHVVWERQRGAPLNPSPLLHGDELYTVSDGGVAQCLDAETGEQHWEQRLSGNFSASPLFADGKIYFLNETGECTVIEPGLEYQELAVNVLPGRTLASPATADGAIFLRTDTHLYRIEQ